LTVNPASSTYKVTLRFIICDDFGVDEDDLYAPSLIAFWILQHERTPYRPFIHEFSLVRELSGLF
jgi:hypothetical protein